MRIRGENVREYLKKLRLKKKMTKQFNVSVDWIAKQEQKVKTK